MLEDIISNLKRLIDDKKQRDLSSCSEAIIKQGIILSILKLLGWNPDDTDEVIPEYTVGNLRVDYALNVFGDKKVFIEAKSGNQSLDDHQEQLLNYSFREGIPLAILTNGSTWWFYLPLKGGNWEQRRCYSINIKEQEAMEISQKFVDFLSKEKVASGEAVKNAEKEYESGKKKGKIEETLPKAWDKIISEPDELLVELLMDKTEEICGYRPEKIDIISFLKEKKEPIEKIVEDKPEKKEEKKKRSITDISGISFTLSDFKEMDRETLKEKLAGTQPSKFIADSEVNVNKWAKVDREFVKWLVRKNYLRKHNIPIYSYSLRGGKYFINTEKKHRDSGYKAYWSKVGDYYIDTKYDGKGHVLNYICALEQLGLSQLLQTVKIYLE